jgi:PIN domain nuclease of toxin-antitoxin system
LVPAERPRALLDTHALLWMLRGEQRISKAARAVIDDPAAPLVVSAASLWEIAIKRSLGKLKAPADLARRLAAGGQVELLPIFPRHADAVADLPWHHRDAFDRLLVAQALLEDLTLLSADPQLADYGVSVVW